MMYYLEISINLGFYGMNCDFSPYTQLCSITQEASNVELQIFEPEKVSQKGTRFVLSWR